MPSINYITASCTISNRTITKNGQPFFQGTRADDVPAFLLAAYQHTAVQYPKFYKMDGLSKLGWLAAEILLQNSHVTEKYPAKDIGIVLANANASLDTDIKYYETAKAIASPALFVYTLPNIVTGEISIRHKLKGETAFFVFETFNANFIQQYVNNLLNNANLQACLCGWVELLGNQYKAMLLLVEKQNSGTLVSFTTENIQTIYDSANG